jgi:hypothetical protein
LCPGEREGGGRNRERWFVFVAGGACPAPPFVRDRCCCRHWSVCVTAGIWQPTTTTCLPLAWLAVAVKSKSKKLNPMIYKPSFHPSSNFSLFHRGFGYVISCSRIDTALEFEYERKHGRFFRVGIEKEQFRTGKLALLKTTHVKPNHRSSPACRTNAKVTPLGSNSLKHQIHNTSHPPTHSRSLLGRLFVVKATYVATVSLEYLVTSVWQSGD